MEVLTTDIKIKTFN